MCLKHLTGREVIIGWRVTHIRARPWFVKKNFNLITQIPLASTSCVSWLKWSRDSVRKQIIVSGYKFVGIFKLKLECKLVTHLLNCTYQDKGRLTEEKKLCKVAASFRPFNHLSYSRGTVSSRLTKNCDIDAR